MSDLSPHMQCLCGAVREPCSSLASETFPIETEMCHCNICRQISGALAGTYFELRGSPSETALAACSRYRVPAGVVDWYFCSQCGTRTFQNITNTGKWSACSGTVEMEPKGAVIDTARVIAHAFVGDTRDGGLALLTPRIGGRDIPFFIESHRSGRPEMTSEEIARLATPKIETSLRRDSDRLHAACHCEAVRFEVIPPSIDSMQDPLVARWLRAGGKKYLGLNCMCRYCRLAIGFNMSSNTYVMPENIVVRNGDGAEERVFDYTSRDDRTPDFARSVEFLQNMFPTLVFDLSSAGNRRCFCGVCGASVFFERESRPQCVNISVGILRADSGSLAKEWIDFDWNLVWEKESAANRSLVEALEAIK